MKRASFLFWIGVSVISVSFTVAQTIDDEIVTDEDSLFGGEGESSDAGSALEESLFGEPSDAESPTDSAADPRAEAPPLVQIVESASAVDSELLIAEAVEIGGRFSFSGQSSWTWNDPPSLFDSFGSPDAEGASVDLEATLYFDARPLEEFRVFGKSAISYPFDSDDGREFDDVVRVDELFSDFTWNDRLFFRVGKHKINWGVGYFFSPADLLNVTEKDPHDPEAEPEGPVSLRAQLPIDIHNLYLYLIAQNIESWNEVGLAAKAEFVVGNLELGVGALYQTDVAPSAMLTASVPLLDVDLFGEAVLRYGSDRKFVEESTTAPFGVQAISRDDELFFHATAGFSFIYPFEADDSSVALSAQYLFNGEGYDDAAILADNASGVAALIGLGEILPDDLFRTGLHYAAANASWSNLFGSEIALRGFWLHNFSDMSGSISPSVALTLFDRMIFTLSTTYRYGEAGDEYAPAGDALSIQFSAGIGGGGF